MGRRSAHIDDVYIATFEQSLWVGIGVLLRQACDSSHGLEGCRRWIRNRDDLHVGMSHPGRQMKSAGDVAPADDTDTQLGCHCAPISSGETSITVLRRCTSFEPGRHILSNSGTYM
jgi:hypothetical protein